MTGVGASLSSLTVIINLFDTDLNCFISIILMGVAIAEFGS